MGRRCDNKSFQGLCGDNNTIDWFAFQGSQSGVQHGQTRFTLFTTGTKCNQVAFAQVRTFFFLLHFSVISFYEEYYLLVIYLLDKQGSLFLKKLWCCVGVEV